MKTHPMKPGRFDGSGSLDTFLAQFSRLTCADYNGWSERDKCAHLKCSLDATIMGLRRPRAVEVRTTQGPFERSLWFIWTSREVSRRTAVPTTSFGRVVKRTTYFIRRLIALVYPDAHGNLICELIARDHYLSALGDRQLELKLREREPTDLDAALRLALRLEAYDVSYRCDTVWAVILEFRRRGSPPRRCDRDQDDKLARRIAQIERSVAQQNETAAKPRFTTEERGTNWRRITQV